MTHTVSAAFEDIHRKLTRVHTETGKVIFGQDEVIEQTLITLISGGHLLLVGVPGLAKTLLVETIATVLGLSSNRIQCTPDLMPADILGSEVLDTDASGKRSFRLIKGPVFTQFLMVDEINRASPRTQSALLQAMQEKQVSLGGENHKLPEPFHVLATQNPIEHEGTYPLPEAQLDRFFMQVDMHYPGLEAERDMLLATTTNKHEIASPVLNEGELVEIQKFIRDMPVGENVIHAILTLVRKARPGKDAPAIVNDHVTWAPGPRASQSLMLAVRARALLQGRETPSIEDVVSMAEPVFKHRMALNYKARTNHVSLSDVIKTLAEKI